MFPSLPKRLRDKGIPRDRQRFVKGTNGDHLTTSPPRLQLNMVWLVVYLPLWKVWKSIGMIIANIWKQNMFQTTNQWVSNWGTSYSCYSVGRNSKFFEFCAERSLSPIPVQGSTHNWHTREIHTEVSIHACRERNRTCADFHLHIVTQSMQELA